MKAKKILTFFFTAVLFSHHFSSAQIITNGGFENWAIGASSYLDPVGWTTSNGIAPNANVVQAAGRTGAYSANLLSIPDTNSQITQANLYFDYTGNLKPLVLSGYWKGNFLTPSNFLYVSVRVVDASFTEIGFGSAYSPQFTNVTNWIPFSDTINYSSANSPISTSIQFTLFSTSLSTTGFVDDLTLTYTTPTGEIQTIPLTRSSLSQDFYGNYLLNLNLLSPSTFTLNIFSIDGKKVSEKNYSADAGQHKILLPTENLSQGIYFVKMNGGKQSATRKLVVVR